MTQWVLFSGTQTQTVVTLGRVHSISNSRLAARRAVLPTRERKAMKLALASPKPLSKDSGLLTFPEPWLLHSRCHLPVNMPSVSTEHLLETRRILRDLRY